jgi:hypothetical protein
MNFAMSAFHLFFIFISSLIEKQLIILHRL